MMALCDHFNDTKNISEATFQIKSDLIMINND